MTRSLIAALPWSTHEANFPRCSQAGCPNPGKRPVLTNYGYLGDLCEAHYAELQKELDRA